MLRLWSLTLAGLLFALGGFTAAAAQPRSHMPPQVPQAEVPAAGLSAGAPIILAQSDGGLFRSLFGGRREVKRGREIRRAPKIKTRSSPKRSKKNTRSAGTGIRRTAPASVAKSPEAKTILVVGDFMANALAKGLDAAFATNPDIDVINASNAASGLVRDDFHDWNAKVPELVTARQASMVLVMIGGNDRQAIRTPSGQIPVGSDPWRAAYEAKVTAFADMLAAQGVPVIWLSLVPVSSGSLSRDYSGFNSIYRQQAELKGLTFADVWNGFADDKGVYVSSGPDINGQTRRLRTGDGLNFARAGRRKLAFFVERDIARLLSEGQSPVFAGLGAGPGAEGGPAALPSLPAVSPMIPIGMISVQQGSGLSSAPKADDGEPGGTPAVAAQSGDRIRAVPPPGRADNFAWPAPQ